MVIDLGTPNVKQELFLKDTHKHVGFGGARGGGKSWAIRAKAVILACRHPGIKIMIIRKTYPELQANHIKPLKAMLMIGTKSAAAKYNEQRKEIVFPNGSTILFQYCNAESDVDRLQGTEMDVCFIDEATMLSEAQIKAIVACVRGVNNFPKRVYYTMNPGGKSHGYMRRLFLDKDYVEGEYAEEYSFIQSLVTDNKALMESDPEYVRQLEALPESLKKAWLYGDWYSFVGQCFDLKNDPAHYADRRFTHVIDDLEDIPLSWKIYRGFDFGYSKPFSVVWIAIDHYGRMYHFKEWYGCTKQANTGVMLTVQEIADGILEREASDPRLRGRKIYGIADPAIWEASHGESIAEMMEKQRVYFQRGEHARLPGKMQWHYRLNFNDDGIPMFYVCKSCKQFIRTIPLLIYDERPGHEEDINSDGEDHIYDAVRYVFMEHPLNPIKNDKPKPPADDPLDIWKGI